MLALRLGRYTNNTNKRDKLRRNVKYGKEKTIFCSAINHSIFGRI